MLGVYRLVNIDRKVCKVSVGWNFERASTGSDHLRGSLGDVDWQRLAGK